MKYIKIIFIAVVVILFCTVYIQNREIFDHQFKLELDLYAYKMTPYYVYNVAIIGIAFLLGVLFSVVLGVFHSTGKSSEIKSKERRIKQLETEVLDLENKLTEKDKKEANMSVFGSPSTSDSSS